MIKTGIARIYVEGNFCINCGPSIKKELLKINDLSNVYLRPDKSLIVFSFVKANEISNALNLLTSLGYPPKGDKVINTNMLRALCAC